MTQALPNVSLGSSRLVRFLTDLSATDTRVSHRRFTERLGQLIDFSDSVTLSEAHAAELRVEAEEADSFREGIIREFLRARSAIIQVAMRSFYPSGHTPRAGQAATAHARIRWPSLEAPPPADAESAAAPYLKFYSRQQLDVEGKIRGLHLRSRAAVAPLSVTLARICAIDAALYEALNQYARRYFSAIPRLLQQRLNHLFGHYEERVERGEAVDSAWLETREQFRRETRGLLLAEIEARLLPVLGLIEALNEEIPYED